MVKHAELHGPDGTWQAQDGMIIGRKPPADIVLPFAKISRQHARIEKRDFGYWIVDLGSRNGTFVNGEPIGADGARLVGGGKIVLGGIVALTFVDPDETAVGPKIGRLRGIWIDPTTKAVFVDTLPVEPPLSPAQFTLLNLLYFHPNQIISREQIIATVWPDVDAAGVSGEAVDGLIKRLRKRLRDVLHEPEYIDVVRGHGLRLVQPDD